MKKFIVLLLLVGLCSVAVAKGRIDNLIAIKATPVIKTVVQKLYCDACGKCLTNNKGESCIGISIELTDLSTNSKGFFKQQLGKYRLDKTYRICWECWLKSLGAKP